MVLFFSVFYLVLPHITPFNFDGEANRGDSVQVSCYMSKGDFPVSFSWLLNGKPTKDFQDVTVSIFGKKTSVLSIDSADQHHAGNYTCVASNRAGISTFSARLIVKGNSFFLSIVLPKIQPFQFGEEPAFVGETATVQCSISLGDMPVVFSWLLNNRPVTDFSEINVGSFGKKTSVLNIDFVSENHAGNYTCLAKNKAGVAAFTTVLIVKGWFIS